MSSAEDPYAGFRDSKGRFKKGHPGNPKAAGGKRKGAGRPITWTYESKVYKETDLLIEKLPKCVCGYQSYRFKTQRGYFYARCNACNEEYVYDATTNRWSPARFSTVPSI